MQDELHDLREQLRQCKEGKLVERLRTDAVSKDLVDANRRLNLPRYWLGRLYVILSVLTNVTIINFEHLSLGHTVLTRTGPSGWVLLHIIGALALLGLADVVINDILPQRIVLPFAIRWRHLIYMALSVALASLMFVITAIYGNSAVNFVLGLDMAMAASIGVLAPFARHRWTAP
jgi:hypothetical protein